MRVKRFLGLGKTMYNSNITELVDREGQLEVKILLSERLTRKKWDGGWPLKALLELKAQEKDYEVVVENRDISLPRFKEELYQKNSPFYEMLKGRKLDKFISKENEDLLFMGHHLAHAYSALFQSPFKKCFILVMDGGGTSRGDYKACDFSSLSFEESGSIEHTSLFIWDGKELKLLKQEYLDYEKIEGAPFKLADAIGSYYERVAQVIFNDGMSSGKVMGLAGWGESFFDDNLSFLENQKKIDWDRAFKGGGKAQWQKDKNLSYWKDLAATVQEAFEYNLRSWVKESTALGLDLDLDQGLPLIFTGGCALNCSANFKIYKSKIVDDFFIPANPGDEGVSLGLAYGAYLRQGGKPHFERSKKSLNSYFGKEYPLELGLFKDYFVAKRGKDYAHVIKCLENEGVVGWYQGRSECGPRALGHRSLLANCEKVGIKDYLNKTIKYREDFRPYGASILGEEAHHYFDCEEDFHNPFMSYAVKIKEEKQGALKEVCHVDGTCRMQTVYAQASPQFYQLIKEWSNAGHLPLLLNTSLNIMGEPIIDSPRDLLNFFKMSSLNTIIYEDYLIQKELSV